MRILVTGGAGYIGSHAVLHLLERGDEVTVIDSLVRGHAETMRALQPLGDLVFEPADLSDTAALVRLMRERRIDAVMHFAALAYVGESVEQPLRYARSNVGGSLSLLDAMDAAGVARIVFSSSCATYGEPPPERIPIDESCPQQPINPYGWTKLAVERMLSDHGAACRASGKPFASVALRYFNVAGADPEGRVFERHDPETHLIPICLEAAAGTRESVTIYGTDYSTPDGTCIRDYLYVGDLVEAHVRALQAMQPGDCRAYNVGLGRGSSVREVIEACERVTGRSICVREGARRAGDPSVLFAAADRIRRDLGWQPRVTDLDEMIATAWHAQCELLPGARSPGSASLGLP